MAMTEREALDRIAALCNDRDEESSGGGQWSENGALRTTEVRAILAEVSPEPGDSDECIEVIDRLSALLQGVAVALRGPEPPLTSWSFHDLPERAAAAVAGGVLDREQARPILDDALDRALSGLPVATSILLDRLAACVRPAAIDRDALEALIEQDSERESWSVERFADAILALVQPVAGVTLTPEEAAVAAWALRTVRGWPGGMGWDGNLAHSRAREALAARLEEAS